MKKPVVGGQAHGLPELVEQSGGGLAVSQEPGEVAQALDRIIGDRGLGKKMGETGHALVEAKYSVPAVTTALENLYRGLIKAGSGEGAGVLKGMAHG